MKICVKNCFVSYTGKMVMYKQELLIKNIFSKEVVSVSYYHIDARFDLWHVAGSKTANTVLFFGVV